MTIFISMLMSLAVADEVQFNRNTVDTLGSKQKSVGIFAPLRLGLNDSTDLENYILVGHWSRHMWPLRRLTLQRRMECGFTSSVGLSNPIVEGIGSWWHRGSIGS